MSRGIKIKHHKNTHALQAVRIGHCGMVTLLMRQGIGAPCVPCVTPGERVLAGQLVGEAQAPLAAPVHASVSGTVKKIDTVRLPTGEDVQAVVVESDGQMEFYPFQAPAVHSREAFLAAVRDSGLVGLGGAGFPTHAKLRSAAGEADILLVNASECEPYITTDHREALDRSADIIAGIQHICRWLQIREAVIGIEDNKSDAISLLKGLCWQNNTPELRLRTGVLPSRYPQGAEKIFIHTLTKRVVPLGKLPSAVGALVMNVASVSFLGRYFRTGRPLISRTVTVDGGAVPHPMNVRVPIGISVGELLKDKRIGFHLEHASDSAPLATKIIMGGPMMGVAGPDYSAVISKCNNSVILFNSSEARLKPESACIRCGRCVAVCPMRLQPLKLEKAWQARSAQDLRQLNAMGCMECGCCSYACPAGRELVQRIRLGKKFLRDQQTKGGA
ncbi:MAG: electron transport complex subunit RsxC [Oscillospiraceae bacterium]|nr:electron transport complex subunit RsxC [Oscillospiraceae bacterium]